MFGKKLYYNKACEASSSDVLRSRFSEWVLPLIPCTPHFGPINNRMALGSDGIST